MRTQDGYVVNEWVFVLNAPIPVWVARKFHKISESSENLESVHFGTAHAGDRICRVEKTKIYWIEKEDARWRMTDGTNGHKWGFWKGDQFASCRHCGQIRRGDDKNPQCEGRAILEFRD